MDWRRELTSLVVALQVMFFDCPVASDRNNKVRSDCFHLLVASALQVMRLLQVCVKRRASIWLPRTVVANRKASTEGS